MGTSKICPAGTSIRTSKPERSTYLRKESLKRCGRCIEPSPCFKSCGANWQLAPQLLKQGLGSIHLPQRFSDSFRRYVDRSGLLVRIEVPAGQIFEVPIKRHAHQLARTI